MSRQMIVVLSLVAVVFVATLSIFKNIGKAIGNIPIATPLDIPSALKKSDRTYASTSGEKTATKSATPSGQQNIIK